MAALPSKLEGVPAWMLATFSRPEVEEFARLLMDAVSPPTIAPWPDFLGNEIRHGDHLTHPDGTEFIAVRFDGFEDEGDAWRAVYGPGQAAAYLSRLSLEIGDKGQAIKVCK